MKIRVLSDLHLEFCDWIPPRAEADVVVLAGDIHAGASGIEWARRRFTSGDIIYVPGNHEFYGGRMDHVLAQLRAEARRFGVHLLDGDGCTLNGVRFLGATLWTDFSFYGSAPAQIAMAMEDASYIMNDFRVIRNAEGGLFRPEQSRKIHAAQAHWLQMELKKAFSGPTVVVSHFLPHRISIHRKYETNRLNPCFATDLDHLVRPPVSLWIHGHTHETVDAVANGTRVVCNPRGYLPAEPNEAFDPCFIAQV